MLASVGQAMEHAIEYWHVNCSVSDACGSFRATETVISITDQQIQSRKFIYQQISIWSLAVIRIYVNLY